MTSTMPLLILLLVMLSASLYYIIKAEGGFGEFPRLMERVGISMDKIQMPKSKLQINPEIRGGSDFASGDSRFSQGACVKDSDCFVGGCSGEVCGSEPDIVTTCEFSESFPNVKDFQCGCVRGVCGWSRE